MIGESGQAAVFFLCVLLGFIGGVLYEPFRVLRKILFERIAWIADCLFFCCFSLFCVFFTAFLDLPLYRGYMI
ncbi:MAG: hypothetical protein IIX01_00695, partial [Clostridia bacterium]|nr:hypothetical protein [Clostridia bacterium]